MEDRKNKKKVVQLAEDGLPKADVSHYTATPEHLTSYDRAADELYRFKVPALLDTKDRHSYLLIGLMDGTGNDVAKDPLHATNVARFEAQADKLKKSGVSVDVVYKAGPGTQKNIVAENLDAATGHTSKSIAESMYQDLVDRAQEIYERDPDAKIAIHIEGFSRGASQVPILARMIHDRGIPNLYRPEYVSDARGNITETYPHFHQAPGHTPMSVGLYDPVPTGAMEKLDRRLPPSVVSGFQINAADEKRGKFPVDRIIPAGLSEDGRFLSVSVAGAHSDIGGSYQRNGLGTRSQNLMTDYHNALFSEPLLRRLPETYDPRLNVIHRSEEGSIFRFLPKTQRDLPAGEVTKLMPDDGSPTPSDPVAAAARHRPEPMSAAVVEVAQRATPVVRALPQQFAALPAEEAMAEWHKKVGNVELQPYQPPMQLSPGAKVMAAAGVAGIAASVVDAKASADRASTLLSQDNPLAAQSELTHYAARGTGGWIGGASAGLVATAAATGPGVVGFIVVGGAAVAGAHVGEHVATVLDSYKTYTHTLQGVEWASNGRQWVRKDLGDMIDDGQNEPIRQDFAADPETADQLNYEASKVATEMAIGKLRSPQNPYSQPAAENDPVSMRRADWERNSQSGAWERKVVQGFEQPGVPIVRIDRASAERAAELDQASQQVIRENIANGPAPMAARFQMVHRSEGWERFGVVPPSIESALRDDSLTASDGKLYQRTADGQWQRNGESVVASGNLRQELESTRAALQPQLAQHEQQVAAIPNRQPPTLEDIERKDLLTTLNVHEVQTKPEQLEAMLEAVRRTQQEQGINPLTTSLHLGLSADKKFDINSPIEHVGRDADGANRVQAVTSPLEVQMAMLDLRSPPPTTPEAPELRIANLSPQQRDALEQVVREANRLGLKRDDVQDTARQAVAGAADREPAIVVGAIDVDRLQPAPKVEASSDALSPAPTKPAIAEIAVEKPKEPQRGQNRTEDGHTPAESLDGAQRTAAAPSVVSLATAPPVRDAQNSRALAEPESPSAPNQVEPAPVTVAPAEPVKPDVLVAKPPAQQVPTPHPAPAPDVPTPTPSQPAPQVTPPVAAEAASAPDDGTLRRGDRGDDVEMLQFRLQRVGYRGTEENPIPERGHFDAATEHAVRQLQRDHGLPDTGRVDPDTVQALALAQQAKIETQKAGKSEVEALATEKAPKPAEPASARDGGVVESVTAAMAASPPGVRPNEAAAFRPEPPVAPNDSQSTAREQRYAQNGDAAGNAIPDRSTASPDLSGLSPADKAMFAKIRGKVSVDVPDETVAAVMLAAKRNGIPDAESIGPVGVANGKLWVGAQIPGYHTGVSAIDPAPPMQHTLRETQSFNQQREQQLAQEASQRNPDDPSRGPSR
ncbi:putative peptidoglycan binding domain protein [Lysobacter antibioticus]|uniref:peptidoglycan-binding protein n=1 Tax=Lysobacter antibioticus TaxID=84531 RepID=UPI0007173922|nr:peptidoglycan-binding protein [Lysobacter antibioticus]ALN65917.1 putative peptidoglycan binding domain protein [Lysobacter antibioticus]